MSLRSRLSIAVAAGTLLAAAAATPAVADEDWGNDQGGTTAAADNDWGNNQGGTTAANNASGNDPGGDWGGHNNSDNNQRLYQGIVTARSLALRSAPTRGSQVIRYASRGEILSIFCKVGGQRVDGNPLWYQITDGTWAWGPARYIDNIGPAPRWC